VKIKDFNQKTDPWQV